MSIELETGLHRTNDRGVVKRRVAIRSTDESFFDVGIHHYARYPHAETIEQKSFLSGWLTDIRAFRATRRGDMIVGTAVFIVSDNEKGFLKSRRALDHVVDVRDELFS